MERQQEDLRVRKTKAAIRNAFKDMICEMEYDQITIKELAYRAQINRKTFYLHYKGIEDVLAELQEEIADNFIKRKVSYSNMKDIRHMIRVFFETLSHMPLLHERLLCCASYQSVWNQVNQKIMHHRMETNRGAFGMEKYTENIIFAFYGSTSTLIYRQWVEDGKKLPLDELIDIATKLICDGMFSVVREQ